MGLRHNGVLRFLVCFTFILFIYFALLTIYIQLDYCVQNGDDEWPPVRATADGGAELAGDPKLNIFTE